MYSILVVAFKIVLKTYPLVMRNWMEEIMNTLNRVIAADGKILFKYFVFLRKERREGSAGERWALAKTDFCLNLSSTVDPLQL